MPDYHDAETYLAYCEELKKRRLGIQDYSNLIGRERKLVRDRNRHRIKKDEEKQKAHEWYLRNRKGHKDSNKDANLRNRHGLELKNFRAMVEQQKGLCLICATYKGEFLVVDHDHNTGRIRGLLCKNCNLVIGNCLEKAEIAEKAAEYIRRHCNESKT